MKWYVGDWLRDPAVAALSPATRGIWFDALCCMDDLDTFKLTGSTRQWIAWCRCTPEEFSTAVDELLEWDVCEVIRKPSRSGHNGVTGNVTLVSRRRKRVHESRENARIRKKRQREGSADDGGHSNVTPEVTPNVTPTHARARADSDSDSDSDSVSEKKKEKVSAAAGVDSEHVTAYINVTRYAPPLVHQDLMAHKLRPYPVDLWAAHVQVWMDTPQWNEKNAKRVLDSFLEASAKDVAELQGGKPTGPTAMCITCKTNPRTTGPWCDDCKPND